MRIDLDRHLEAAASGNPIPSKGHSPSRAEGSQPKGDVAEVSSSQATVPRLAAEVNRLPEIRQEKVTALAHLIQNGAYRVSSDQAAEAMMAHLSGGLPIGSQPPGA